MTQKRIIFCCFCSLLLFKGVSENLVFPAIKKCAKKLWTIIYIRKIPTYNSMWINMISSSPYIPILGTAKICTFTTRVRLGIGLITCGSRMLLDTTSIIHRRVSIFIATQDAWRSKSGILYLYKYPNPFINAYISPLLVILQCLASLDVLLSLTPATNSNGPIQHCKINVLLSVVVYGCVRRFL